MSGARRRAQGSWDAVTGSVDDAVFQIHGLARQVMMATVQVAQAGAPLRSSRPARSWPTPARPCTVSSPHDEEAEGDAQG